jgi:hypothetical protein
MFSIWVKFLELDDSTCPIMVQLKSNKDHWKSQLETEKKVDTNAPSPSPPPTTIATATAPNTNVQEEKKEPQGDGSNKVAPAP